MSQCEAVVGSQAPAIDGAVDRLRLRHNDVGKAARYDKTG